ncbi:hypothetical protein K9N68_37680 (plasmid) [Kovacikia minuta CCNUW1]|uniref:hypothetical protein n=1 Tax=Kovacikia minuta TaxID=2931930 RepID=UPI001CCB83A5|nr:hypothetical protein [Kovacikia minuta]UBF29943.1 hypothetical protein K9N68_37680 [Kovacikia minuta CCNUW1]
MIDENITHQRVGMKHIKEILPVAVGTQSQEGDWENRLKTMIESAAQDAGVSFEEASRVIWEACSTGCDDFQLGSSVIPFSVCLIFRMLALRAGGWWLIPKQSELQPDFNNPVFLKYTEIDFHLIATSPEFHQLFALINGESHEANVLDECR